MSEQKPEPWLRGTLANLPAIIRAVLHALELAREDIERWCGDLSDLEIHERPFGLPSVAFQLRHIGGSLDRLLTYADARELTTEQMSALSGEWSADESAASVLRGCLATLDKGMARVRAFAGRDFEEYRVVGRKRLPTSLGGLLVHVADHTQRHVGQAITTAKVLRAQRQG
jgi:uncharacterized damage-inducible protein DinB